MNGLVVLPAATGTVSSKDAAAAHPKQDHSLRHSLGTLKNVRPPDSKRY